MLVSFGPVVCSLEQVVHVVGFKLRIIDKHY